MPAVPLLRETQTLHGVIAASALRLIFTKHARDEMAADDIIEADVRKVMDGGAVTWIETKKEELWHVEGRDVDGRSIRLVIAVYADELAVKIITAMILKR